MTRCANCFTGQPSQNTSRVDAGQWRSDGCVGYAVARVMIHIAVLLKPYLDLVLAGEKTVECRMTRQARAPYQAIEPGDRIYLKQSAGPYRGVAVADHVLFECDLTPKRVREICRDYNSMICGTEEVWQEKLHSRYITLIWLRDVQPIDTGPAIRPLQGAAWMTFHEEPPWRRPQPVERSFSIEVTPGNLRNNSLYVTKVLKRFPAWTHGGATRETAAKPMTLVLHDGPTVQTDIVKPRKLLRTRIWGDWFQRHGVKPGDRVVFTPDGDGKTFYVGLARAT